jgi:hypothetical protein
MAATASATNRKRARLWRLALGCMLVPASGWPLGVAARSPDGPTITVAEPEGFANLTDERILLVDVYFGGVRTGEAKVSAAPGVVRLLEPAEVIEALPALTDRAAVEAALGAGTLAANASLACSAASDSTRCGRLSPDVIGVIFDRDRFRLDVFVNPRFLAVRDRLEDAYLPEPQRGLAMVNSVGAVISGRLGRGSTYYNFQDSLVLASGERRLRADLTLASGFGLGTDRLAFELDRPGLRLSAGALWAPGSELAGRRKLVGAGIESQIDTRLDKDELTGSPIVVYLDQRARVDVVRDGRVLNSAIYEAGNQAIDTANLPEGSYDVVLRIDEPGRPAREERRFYTKSRRIPSQGRTDFFAFAGMLIDDFDRGSLNPSNHPYFQGGVARRLRESLVIAGVVEATDQGASAEVAATFLTPLAQIRTAAVIDLDGAYGGILQLTSAGSSRLTFNFDLRRIEQADGADRPMSPIDPLDPFGVPELVRYGGSYMQAGGIVSYSSANLRLLGTVFYRDDEAERARYSIGPSLEWDMLRKGALTLTLRGDLAATERGGSGFAGLSLRLLGARSTLTALGGARASGIADDDLGEGPVAAVSGAWNPTLAGGDLALGAGFEHQPRQDNVVLSSEYRHPFGSMSGDLVHSDGPGSAVTQYSLGFQTTVAAGGGTLHVVGRTTTESLIVARVEGAREGDRFDVLVNEQVAGTIEGVGPMTLSLPAYRAYAVRIRPTGEGLLAYDSSARSVGLYPGTVAGLEWSVAPITIKIGRLVAPDGTPVRGASITGKGVWSETDDEGHFQIEVPEGAELTVTMPNGNAFAMTLPAGKANGGIAQLGSVVCCGEGEIRLGALGSLNSHGE